MNKKISISTGIRNKLTYVIVQICKIMPSFSIINTTLLYYTLLVWYCSNFNILDPGVSTISTGREIYLRNSTAIIPVRFSFTNFSINIKVALQSNCIHCAWNSHKYHFSNILYFKEMYLRYSLPSWALSTLFRSFCIL